MLILSDTDVIRAADAEQLLGVIDASFRDASAGEAQVPARIKLSLAHTDNRLIVMPAYLPRCGALATKLVTVFPGNLQREIPLILGVVVLNDPDTGVPLALIEGGVLTGLRTAAASAVSARELARPGGTILGVIGSGTQGRAHVWAFAQLYPLREVRVCSRNTASARRLAKEAAPWIEGSVRAVPTPEDAARGADLVVTATTSSKPVLEGKWLNGGVHVCAVGAATLTHREIDTDVVTGAAVIAVDSREGALAEAGDLVIPINEGRLSPDRLVELGDILLGRSPGRKTEEEITLYKGVGMAAMDAAVAHLIYHRARELGLGVDVSLNG